MRPATPRTMTVPEVRDRLYELAGEMRSEELMHLANQLWRRRPGKVKARASAVHMTPELAQSIRDYAVTHPWLSEHRIGIEFGVNQGRVSEALFGFRGEDRG